MSVVSQEQIDELRRAMHEAPLNKVFQDHTGHRFLGTHSTAWATASRNWGDAFREREADAARAELSALLADDNLPTIDAGA